MQGEPPVLRHVAPLRRVQQEDVQAFANDRDRDRMDPRRGVGPNRGQEGGPFRSVKVTGAGIGELGGGGGELGPGSVCSRHGLSLAQTSAFGDRNARVRAPDGMQLTLFSLAED